jgi:tetratricopeptide (TPR) repeat protein
MTPVALKSWLWEPLFNVLTELFVNRVILLLSLILALPSQSLAQESADVEDWHQRVAASDRLYKQGRLREATVMLESALKSAERFPSDDSRRPTTIDAVAMLYQETGRYTEAISYYLRAIRLWKRIGPSQHRKFLNTMNHLISTYVETKDYRTARKLLNVVLPELDRFAMTPRDRFQVLQMRASLEAGNQDYRRAVDTYHQALEQLQEGNWPVLVERSRETGIIWLNISEVFIASKEYEHAWDANTAALAQFEKVGPMVNSLLIRTLDRASFILLKLHRPVDAGPMSSRALELAQTVFGADHPVVAGILLRNSAVLHALHDNARAKEMDKKAQAMLKRTDRTPFTIDVTGLTDVNALLRSELHHTKNQP